VTAPYQVIVGLEVHVQLQTRTKLFCRCETTFGAPPNTQTCPVCTGSPGALPVLNRRAFELGMRTALALNCNIPLFTKWDRKQYYYPDLPKGYQISQLDLPMSEKGFLEISDPQGESETRRIGINRAHLEEDAGKSMHDEHAGKADTRIDLNRTGTPLLEIVSEPDLRSAAEAKQYLTELKLLLTYLKVSDCNMQEGSLRVDANVNLHIPGKQGEKIATPIVEIKNLNSFRAVEKAIEYEASRQYEVWQKDGVSMADGPFKTTRGWNDQLQKTTRQREKEDSADYRYFPDPDLMPVVVNEQEIAAARDALGELPASIRQRLQTQYKLKEYDANVIVNHGRGTVAYFEQLAEVSGDARRAANWVQQDVMRTLNETQCDIEDFPVTAADLGGLLKAIVAGDVDNTKAKDVFAEMHASNSTAVEAMKKLGIEKVDSSETEDLCKALLADNPQVVVDVKGGKQQAVGALIGQAKSRNPNVNPGQIRKMLLQLIAAMDG